MVAYSSVGQMNLIIIGIFVLGPGGVFSDNGLTGATFQMVNHGVVSLAAFLLIGLVELRTRHRRAEVAGRARQPAAGGLDRVPAGRAVRAGGARLERVRLGALHPDRRVRSEQPLLGAAASLGIVLAAMYMLRWYSAIAHEGDGERVDATTPDLRLSELAVAVPLLLILLVLSAWPFGVMERIG